MREAAQMIAAQRNDTASLAARVGAFVARLATTWRRRRRARRHLARLEGFDDHRLADLGLTPADLRDLDPGLSALEATRRLARLAQERSDAWRHADRWARR